MQSAGFTFVGGPSVEASHVTRPRIRWERTIQVQRELWEAWLTTLRKCGARKDLMCHHSISVMGRRRQVEGAPGTYQASACWPGTVIVLGAMEALSEVERRQAETKPLYTFQAVAPEPRGS